MILRPPLCVRSSLCAWLLLAACSSEPAKPPPLPPRPPPPLPSAAPAPDAPAEPATQAPAAHEAAEPAAEGKAASVSHGHAKPRASKAPPAKKGAKTSAHAATPSPAPVTPKPAAASGTAKVEAPKPKASGKVNVPSTAHVHFDVPSALQADLDRDPRMQPWINQVVAVIDRCYGQAANGSALAGTIAVQVTTHKEERPDADIKQLPPALSAIVACATGGLMRAKMPFFTGTEGARSLVRIQFK